MASPVERAKRLKTAALGFALTLPPVLLLACVQLLLAPEIVERAGFNPNTENWVVIAYRKELVSSYAWVAATVLFYWILTFALGRGKILRAKSANVILGGAVLTLAFAMAIASLVPEPSQLFKWACPILGLTDKYSGLGADVQTPCEQFAHRAAPTVLLGLPLTLLITSAIIRVVSSRRRWAGYVR